jgi:hypothetical protein
VDDSDVIIEHLEGAPDLVQGWGKLKLRPFQFHARRGVWTFAIFENPDLEPFDSDVPDEGMYVTGRWREDFKSNKDGLAAAREIILRCCRAYPFAHPRIHN